MTSNNPNNQISQIGRYFERVLGLRTFLEPLDVSVVQSIGERLRPEGSASSGLCLLIEIGSASTAQPSIQQMGHRMLEAIRNEWLKKSVEGSPAHVPEHDWCQTSDEEWAHRVAQAGAHLRLAIICGARRDSASHREILGELLSQSRARVLHIPSFSEMNSSPPLKRDAWHLIQAEVASL